MCYAKYNKYSNFMIIIGNKKTYSFEGIHTPRIYINDIEQVKGALKLLAEKGSLTNREMTEETARVRSEDIREIFYLLWRLGFGIDVTKKGREIAFVANDRLDSILELSDKELKEMVLEKLKVYNPFIAILDDLKNYRDKALEFSEKDITKDFHNNRFDGGRVDNTHPLLRWSKDDEWGLVSDKKITDKGIKYVSEAQKNNIFYAHHTVDLKGSEELNVIAHIIADYSFIGKDNKIYLDDILDSINDVANFKIDKEGLMFFLKELMKIGFPIAMIEDGLKINNKIYHDITPQYYVKFKINLIDGIDVIETEEDGEEESIDKDKIIKEFNGIINIIVCDEEIDIKEYSENSKKVSYDYFLKIDNVLPKFKIKNIILPPGWKPLKVSKIGGILLAFVKSGGNLLIFHAPRGRIGSNRNLFNWLPYDLERISFVNSNETTEIGGCFSFPFGEKFMFTKKDKYEEITKGSQKYSLLFAKYNKGLIIFVGFNPSRSFFDKHINGLETNPEIDEKSNVWVYRHIPSINRMRGVNTEYDLYPLLREVMSKNFDVEFDARITGKPGQTDLFIEKPFFCCCEVTPPSSNATGFSKVSEVDGHRKTMIYKGGKKFENVEVGACVLGPSFTIEAGEDKAGAIDMANAMNVSLISYRDLYELLCHNESYGLTEEDLTKIFFNRDKESEASLRIYKLMK